MPTLWNETVEAHRLGVREALLDTAAELVAEHGLTAVTMTQIAEQTHIGRATLYRYFADVDTILQAWHAREIGRHLRQLAEVRDGAESPGERLHAVLTAYARTAQGRHHDTELVMFLHAAGQVIDAQRQLQDMVQHLIEDCVGAGEVRCDITTKELANYSLHALAGAGNLDTESALSRLVSLTLSGLRQGPGKVEC